MTLKIRYLYDLEGYLVYRYPRSLLFVHILKDLFSVDGLEWVFFDLNIDDRGLLSVDDDVNSG